MCCLPNPETPKEGFYMPTTPTVLMIRTLRPSVYTAVGLYMEKAYKPQTLRPYSSLGRASLHEASLRTLLRGVQLCLEGLS